MTIEAVYAESMSTMSKLLQEGTNPLEVAAVMMSQALSLYKTVLSEDDYTKIVESIVFSKNKVQKFEQPTIN